MGVRQANHGLGGKGIWLVNPECTIADLVERMIAAGVPSEIIVQAVRTAESSSEKFSAILRGESEEKDRRRLAADRARKKRKYDELKVLKASRHKGTSASVAQNSPRRIAENCGDSLFLSSLTEVPTDTAEVSKKEPTAEPRASTKMIPADDWVDGYQDLFWNNFPKLRRYEKKQAMETLAKLRREKVSWNEIYSGVLRYAAVDHGKYTKAPLPWLRGQRWLVTEYHAEEKNGRGARAPDFLELALRLGQETNEQSDQLTIEHEPFVRSRG